MHSGLGVFQGPNKPAGDLMTTNLSEVHSGVSDHHRGTHSVSGANQASQNQSRYGGGQSLC